ncbi:hypothetical protein [Roseicyclus marinus]|uniref:hypothetical protein n=1 Tax=Roseicyclus marinus TaxID=2161673 RepID=UPI00240F0D04|nr:hypothetical protein [Roseicyclus marinus]MDG3041117.1 hypothetical protein [Roseicyclus marinus]
MALWRTYQAHLADLPVFDGVEMPAVGMFGGGQLHHGAAPMLTPEDIAGQKFRMGGPSNTSFTFSDQAATGDRRPRVARAETSIRRGCLIPALVCLGFA